MADYAGPRLTLIGREGCGLCEEFEADLRDAAAQRSLPPLRVVDVDATPCWRAATG